MSKRLGYIHRAVLAILANGEANTAIDIAGAILDVTEVTAVQQASV